MEALTRSYRFLICLCLTLFFSGSHSFAQNNLDQNLQKREKNAIAKARLNDQIQEQESEQEKLLLDLTEYRTFVSDYEAFDRQDPKIKLWSKEKVEIYNRAEELDRLVHERPATSFTPLKNFMTDFDMTSLLEDLTGIAGAYAIFDGAFSRRPKAIVLGVVVLGTVLTVKFAPKFIKKMLRDKLGQY